MKNKNKIYQEIYNLCKIKNNGNVSKNDIYPTPRVKFIIKLLDKENIDYKLDVFNNDVDSNSYNIILKGNSDKMVCAHHDIINPDSDNANDNSASIINAIVLKKLLPELNVVLVDGEELGGIGSQRISDLIHKDYFGNISWVLNLELTGIGGEYFFIGEDPGYLYDLVKSKFNCPTFNTPYNDSVTFRANNIDSIVINPLPILKKGKSDVFYKGKYLDTSILYRCHSMSDSVDKINTDDMQIFVENVLYKICK